MLPTWQHFVRRSLFTKDVSKAIDEGIVMTDKNFCSKAEEEVRRWSNKFKCIPYSQKFLWQLCNFCSFHMWLIRHENLVHDNSLLGIIFS